MPSRSDRGLPLLLAVAQLSLLLQEQIIGVKGHERPALTVSGSHLLRLEGSVIVGQ